MAQIDLRNAELEAWDGVAPIPGSVLANLLGGAMFGLPLAFPLCQVLNTLGAIILLFISRRLGKRVVIRFFAERARNLEKQVRSINLQPLLP